MSYLKKTVRNAKREIASNNYLKIDFSTSELTALITLSGAILLLLGYCRVALVNWWLGVPYERYYAISDYIASSVNSISQYLVAATATAIFWGIYLATINAYSLQSASAEARTLHGRIQSWALHFVGISSVLALIVVYLSDRKIDAISFEVVVAYIGMPLIGHASARFFSAPYRAFLFLALFFSAFVTGLAGVITEIQRITAPNSGYPTRVLNFTNVQYNEPEWAVIGITSSFAILRRRADGIVQVQAKSELKRVDDLPAKPVGRISP